MPSNKHLRIAGHYTRCQNGRSTKVVSQTFTGHLANVWFGTIIGLIIQPPVVRCHGTTPRAFHSSTLYETIDLQLQYCA